METNVDNESITEEMNADLKSASEADTLPMDAKASGPATVALKTTSQDKTSLEANMTKFFRPILVSKNPLSNHPTSKNKILHSFRCPPHGVVARIWTLVILVLALWAACLSVFVPVSESSENSTKCESEHNANFGHTGSIAEPPGGTIFILIVLIVFALLSGKLFSLARLPPLLGMLLTGIVIKNIPGMTFDQYWTRTSSILRGIALVVILMRAGLGLDPQALKRLSGMVFRLAFTPCLVETVVVAVASHLLLGFPWMWGFMLGFVLAAVSPAVVVPSLLGLQERGYGVDKGIPTLVIAAASVDDVLAISGFTILLGITFKPEQDLLTVVFQGPKEAVIGLLFGIAWALLVTLFPGKDDAKMGPFRFVILFLGGIIAYFGSKAVELEGAGALAVLVMAFVAGIGWRKLGWTDENTVTKTLADFWVIFQPILFGLIGTEIQVSELDPNTVGLGIAVLVISISFRLVVSYLAVLGGDLNIKERIFISMAWLPKATVQAALGPVALDSLYNSDLDPNSDLYKLRKELGLKILTIAVLVILITAPIGSIAITLSGPKLLNKKSSNTEGETQENLNLEEGNS